MPILAGHATDAPSSLSQKEKVSELVLQSTKMEGKKKERREGEGERQRKREREEGGREGGRARDIEGEGEYELPLI